MIKFFFSVLVLFASTMTVFNSYAQSLIFEYAGLPIEDVRLLQEGQILAVSKRNGIAEVTSCLNGQEQCDVSIQHPNFSSKTITIDLSIDTQTITLKPVNEAIEEVLVTTQRNAPRHFDELNTANSTINLSQQDNPPATILEAITNIPGIAENGQGGLFQVYSIRGLSRQRVLTYLGQIPLKAERRAGVASSFLHPLLFSSVRAERGPASTVYLSGSLGGVVQLTPRQFEKNHLYFDYDTVGQRNQQLFGTRLNNWSLGLARQQANNSKNVNNNELNDAYSQYSLSAIGQWRVNDLDVFWTNLASHGDEIGRSSTRFPGRIVTVPEEQHWLSQLQLIDENWELAFFAHPNKVDTLTVRPENRSNLVKNQALDFGGSYKRFWASENLEGTWGLDYFSRKNVSASDLRTQFDDGSQSLNLSLQDAQETEFGLYATASSYWLNSKWQLGGRIIHHAADNSEVATISDSALTAFIGMSTPLAERLFFTANLGTGIRFPTLSERFFIGTTGRGNVIGNPELKNEKSISLDAGISYQANDLRLSFNVYRQEISDYIERIEVAPELLSFRNLNDGTITGIDLESSYNLTENWQTKLSFSVIDGKSDTGTPLIDIPANRLNLSNDYQWRNWNFSNELEFRKRKNSVASNEKPTTSVLLTHLSGRYEFSSDFSMAVQVNNVFDRRYFSSQDELVPLSAGRYFSLAGNYAW